MKTLLKGLGLLIVLVLLAGAASFMWAKSALTSRVGKTYETHRVDFPIPFPLDEAALGELRALKAKELPPDADPSADPLAGVDLTAVALEQARARGKHLVESRYACIECHSRNFAGGTMIDAPPLGRVLGVNLTSGKGGVVASYTAADWDRTVRHGVLPDGRPTPMPSVDYLIMSDQELSDIVTYIRSMPPVDNEVPRPTWGPVGTFLIATGKFPFTAEGRDHQRAHEKLPPPAAETPEFGRHLAGVCTGCHGAQLAGGPIVGGDPSWPPAGNLTPHADGLAGWTYEDFLKAMREAQSKRGRALLPPMAGMKPYAAQMTDTELRAMWAYLQTVPAAPTPKP